MYRYLTALTLLIVALISAPTYAHAGVLINEIAWMGGAGNANAEWIELFNTDGIDVALSGWTLTSAGTAPNITLSGTIAANGYYILERTSDASVPTVTADQIYTGALSNSGDTLTLKDAGGVQIDQVVGGSNWENIGGDNTTKKTAQRSGSSWITADPTPRAVNTSGETTPTATTTPTTTGTTTPTVTIGGTTPTSGTPVASPVRRLLIDAGNDRIVHTGVPTPYRAVAYSEGGNLRTRAKIVWNFGDGKREEGDDVMYAYRHPGEYTVTVRARDDLATTLQTLRVVVEDPQISITTDEQGVLLTNASSRMVDLSSWRLETPEDTFEIPEDTAIHAMGSVLFAADVTGLNPEDTVTLQYPNGGVASAYEIEPDVVISQVQPEPVEVGIQEVATPLLPAPVQSTYEEVIDAPTEPVLAASVGAAVGPVSFPKRLLMCLFGSVLACGASLVVP